MHTLREVMAKTTEITAMVFMILIGATTFAFVFRELEGDSWLIGLLDQLNLSGNGFLLVVLLLVFVAGFFIDFIEIIFIIVPIVSPVFITLGLDLTWVAILLAINLQTSFLTPPFGFSLAHLFANDGVDLAEDGQARALRHFTVTFVLAHLPIHVQLFACATVFLGCHQSTSPH